MDKKARAVFQELREGGGADADFDELEEDGDMEAIEILETAALANEASDSDKAKRQREVKERLQGVMSIRRGGAAVNGVSLRLRCVISLLVLSATVCPKNMPVILLHRRSPSLVPRVP